MNIIAGSARNLILASPPDAEVRPTAGRARKALFDSIGDVNGAGILDLCAGSGALALEAASRGAKWVVMVEKDAGHIQCIRENCRKVAAAGCTAQMLIFEFDILHFPRYSNQLPGVPDIIFADPPYAISAELFQQIMANRDFTAFCSGRRLFWEIPDFPGAAGKFIQTDALTNQQLRKFGSTLFLQGIIKG